MISDGNDLQCKLPKIPTSITYWLDNTLDHAVVLTRCRIDEKHCNLIIDALLTSVVQEDANQRITSEDLEESTMKKAA